MAFPPGQYTSPQLHPCHRLFEQDGHQDSSSASLQSRLCSLWLLVTGSKLTGCCYETIEEMKEAVTNTRGLPWGLPEVAGTIQVHCSRRRLLWRGLEFHVCTINKSALTKKSLETYLMILVSIYLFIYLSKYTCQDWWESLSLYIYIYILYNRGIDIILIKLPQPENPANTHIRHMEHWTAVSTLLGLISSAYHNLYH